MFADTFHPIRLDAADRFRLLFRRLFHDLRPAPAGFPAELRRLPEHMLRDIGIDPRSLPAEPRHLVTPPDILHSRAAMAEFLATTIR